MPLKKRNLSPWVCVCVCAGLMLIRRVCNLLFRDRMEEGLGFESNLKRWRFKLKSLRRSSRFIPRHCHPPPPSLSPLSPSFSAKHHGHGNELVQDVFVHLGWCRKHRSPSRPLPPLPWHMGPLEGGSLACLQACTPSSQPSASGEQRIF